MKVVYLLLCIAGTAVVYSQIIPWYMENGMDIAALIRDAGATRVSAIGWLDAAATAVVIIVFILVESRRLKMKYAWLSLIAIFAVGIALALPLFLLLREIHLARPQPEEAC
jgi:hypothetical protein